MNLAHSCVQVQWEKAASHNLQFVDSCPTDWIQSPWRCMSSPCHDSQVYISNFILPLTVLLACYKAADIFTWTLGHRWLTIQYSCTPCHSRVISSTWPRTTFPAVHPRRWGQVPSLFPVHLSHTLFATCQWDATLEKGGATRWKEPGSLNHHVEGPYPTRTSALLYYMSEK